MKFEILANDTKLEVAAPFYWKDEDNIFDYYYTRELFPIVHEKSDELILIPKHAIQAICITEKDDEK